MCSAVWYSGNLMSVQPKIWQKIPKNWQSLNSRNFRFLLPSPPLLSLQVSSTNCQIIFGNPWFKFQPQPPLLQLKLFVKGNFNLCAPKCVLADYPAMYFFCVCWHTQQIKIQIQIGWVVRSTKCVQVTELLKFQFEKRFTNDLTIFNYSTKVLKKILDKPTHLRFCTVQMQYK